MTRDEERAVVVLAYALYDAECTGRLSEDPAAQPGYMARAKTLLYMIQEYRTESEKKVLADVIQGSRV